MHSEAAARKQDGGPSVAASTAGFGSFASGNVQEMMSLCDDDWAAVAPRPPPEVLAGMQSVHAPAGFGRAARDQFFLRLDEFTFINHGAFGACLRAPYAVAHAWQRHCEAQPLRFLDRCDRAAYVFLPVQLSPLAHAPAEAALAPRVR